MAKGRWTLAAEAKKDATAKTLAVLFGALNQGQQNKVMKEQKVKDLLLFYNIIKEDKV